MSSGSSGTAVSNAGSAANNSKRKNVLLPDAERPPVLLEEGFIDRLLQMASMAFPHPMNPASFALHTSIPTLHQPPPLRRPPSPSVQSMLERGGELSRCSSTCSNALEHRSLSTCFHTSGSRMGKGSTSLGSLEQMRTGGGEGAGRSGLFLSMMMGNSTNNTIGAPFLSSSPHTDNPYNFVAAPTSPASRTGNGNSSLPPSFSNFGGAGSVVAPVVPPGQAGCPGVVSTPTAKDSFSVQDSLGSQRLAPEDYEYIALHLSSAIARSLNLEDYWSNLKSQIKVDSLVFFIFYCAHHRFTALKTLHLLEFFQDYEDLVAAGSNKEGELVAAAAEEAAARAAAAQAALADNSSLADGEVEGGSNGAANGGGGGGAGEASGRTGGASAEKKKSDSKEKKRSKPPSKKEKLAALAAEEERKRKEQEAAELVLEAERQRQLAAERSLLSWEEMLQHTMKDFLTSELELGWRWDQFPWQSNKSTGLLSAGQPGSGGGGVGTQGNGGTGGAAAAAAGGASGSASSTSGKGGGGGNIGGKKKGEKARLQQLQEIEEEQKRLAAAAAALPRENIYLREDEIPLFTNVFLARGLLQHASLYQYVLRHASMEVEEGEPSITYHLAAEVPMESVPPIWMATYKGTTNPYQSLQYAGFSHPSLSSHSGMNIINTPNAEESVGGTSHPHHAGGGTSTGNLSTTQPGPHPTTGHGSIGNRTLPHTASGGMGRGGRSGMVPGGLRERQLSAAMGDFYAARDAEIRGLEQAHQEAVELEKERAKVAEEERQMRLLFQNKKKSEVVEDVYDSVQDCLTSRQLRILQRIEALEQQLGIAKAVNIPAVLQKDSGNDKNPDAKKKGGKKKKYG